MVTASIVVTLLSASTALALRVAAAPPRFAPVRMTSTMEAPPTSMAPTNAPDEISEAAPLHVLIAGAGVGGLVLANCLEASNAPVKYTILERTKEFRKFGGPIQLASNAMQGFRSIDADLYNEIEHYATWTGNRTNGIKDGIRDEWYAKFDLQTPAFDRSMPYTCVVDRPDLQDVLMTRVSHNLRNGAGVESYTQSESGGVTAKLMNGEEVHGDILIGADGIWSKVRATMNNKDPRDGSAYSGYTVFAGEFVPKSASDFADYFDCGYKVYLGPKKYFVTSDVGDGRVQWYSFLAQPPGTKRAGESQRC